MTKPRVEAGDRALETARKIERADFEKYADPQGYRLERIRIMRFGQAFFGQYVENVTQAAYESFLAGAALIQSAMNAGIPMVQRATGRTIPDLTQREHVCEYQSAMHGKAESAMNAQERELVEALQTLRNLQYGFSESGQGFMRCHGCGISSLHQGPWNHLGKCAVAEAERLLAERGGTK